MNGEEEEEEEDDEEDDEEGVCATCVVEVKPLSTLNNVAGNFCLNSKPKDRAGVKDLKLERH